MWEVTEIPLDESNTSLAATGIWKGNVTAYGIRCAWTNNTGQNVFFNYEVSVIWSANADIYSYVYFEIYHDPVNDMTFRSEPVTVFQDHGIVTGTLLLKPGEQIVIGHAENLTSKLHASFIIQEDTSATSISEFSDSINVPNGMCKITLNYNTDNYGYMTYNLPQKESFKYLQNPQYNGYTFMGWYTQPYGCGTRISENSFIPALEQLTLYSYWLKDVGT